MENTVENGARHPTPGLEKRVEAPDLSEFDITTRKLPNGRWIAACYIGRDARGKRIEPKRRGATAAEAKARVEADLIAHLEEREPAAQRTLAMAVDSWLSVVLSRETERGPITPATQKKHQWMANTIKEDRIGKKRLESFTTVEPIQGFLDRHVDHLNRDTLRRLRKMLADVFANEARHGRWSRPNWGELALLPPKARRQKAPVVLSLEATKHFLESVEGSELEAAWRLQAIYGLRPGEVRGLLVENVHLDADPPYVAVVNATTTDEKGVEVLGPLKKDHHRARFSLDAGTARALREQLRRLEFRGDSTCGLMFPTSNDGLITRNNYAHRFRTALRDAGFFNDSEFSPYDLRHTSATLLYEEYGWSKADVAAHLRHINLATVNVYLHAEEIQMQPSPIADA